MPGCGISWDHSYPFVILIFCMISVGMYRGLPFAANLLNVEAVSFNADGTLLKSKDCVVAAGDGI